MANQTFIFDISSLADIDSLAKYALRTDRGGEISANLAILSGTFSGGINAIATGNNSFAYGTDVSAIGENTYAIGKDSVAGCYGWYYDHIDFTNNVFYLTTTLPNTIYTSALTGTGEVDPSFNSGLEVGDVISYVNKKKFDLALSVVAVNGNLISVEPFKDTGKYSLAETEPNHDDWTIFCPKKPLIGEIWLGETAYAEGLNSIALNAYSHAEGKDGFAYGQYAHVEGKRNTAGYASHAEGADVSAIAQYCHAEGLSSTAAANYAHAEGTSVSAFGVASHAEGARTYAKGAGSHAEGGDTTATGEKSHAEGVNTTASGNDSHAEGNLAVASGTHSHAEGSSTAASGSTSHAEGYLTKAVGFAGHTEGQTTVAKGDQSHAEGAGSSTLQSFKVTGAANSKTYTTDKNHSLHVNNIVQYDKTYAKIVAVPELTSFTLDLTLDAVNDLEDVDINLIKGIAYNNKSHVEGLNSIATGETSHAEGGATLAAGKFSHSEGYKTEANGVYSHAAGVSAVTNANCSYVWNGLSSATYEVLSTDIGTFNINPKNGLAGFCIGHHSLIENSLPVSSLSTTVIYKTGEISTLLIEGELLASSIPNIKNAVDVTIGNAVTSIGIKAFFQCDALTCVLMPNSLTAVMNTAFSKCTALTSLIFPDSVLLIDFSGFSNCTNLRTVKFPKRLAKLTDYVSYNCPKLVDVVIPNEISAIGKLSFMNCTGLIHVNIPNSITTIGLSAFTNCNSLTSVEFEYRTLELISTIPNYSTRWGLTDDTVIKPYDWSLTNGYFNVNPKDGISGFYIGTLSLADLIAAGGSTELENYLDKRTGGIIDGNLSVLSSIGSGENSYAAGLNSAAFGEAVSALADASFAEGRLTLANDKYAHAEGSKTKALGERSHAEGAGTFAYGWGSHVEGEETSALWRAGHAEGKKTVAYMYSHAEGSETIAGYDLTAANAVNQGDIASHAEGYQTSAIARFSHAEGYGSIAGILDPTTRPMKGDERNFDIDLAAHAEGHDTSALGHASHAEGRSTIAKGDQSHVGGKYSIVNSSNSFAHGLSCFIDTNASESFAFGNENSISGNGSKMFAIGSRNTISATGAAHCVFVGGLNNTVDLAANGPSFIYGRNNKLTNSGINFVVGENLSCNHNYSILFGTNAESKAQRLFVWSGTSNTYTPSTLTGTFNINPANGINGFYIGANNFVLCVLSAVQSMNETQKAALKTALGL